MAWRLGPQAAKPKPKRNSVGGSEQHTSLREALRARGGARNVATSATDVEDNFPEKGNLNLEWLNLQAFAPRALQQVVDKIRAGELPTVLRRGGDTDAEEVVGNSEGEASDLPGAAPVASAPQKSRRGAAGKPSGSGLRSALQARGGFRVAQQHAAADAAAATAAAVPAPAAATEADAAELAGEAGDQPIAGGPEGVSVAPLASVTEDVEGEAVEAAEDSEANSQSQVGAALEDDARVEPPHQECGNSDSPADVSVAGGSSEARTSAAAQAPPTGPVQSSGNARAVEDASHEREPPRPGGEEAGPDVEEGSHVLENNAGDANGAVVAEPGAAQVGVSVEATAVAPVATQPAVGAPVAMAPVVAEKPTKPSTAAGGHRSAAKARTNKSNVIISSPTAYPLAMSPPAGSPRSDDDKVASAPPKLSPEPPRPPVVKETPGKLKELREFWGKNSVGFAGPQLGSHTRLSRGEAQATLQRLIAAGGDFDEVRRLRKLISELE